MTIFSVIIPAGGTSSRFGGKNKLLEKIHGKEVIKYAVEAFEGANVNEIIVSANPAIIDELRQILGSKVRIVEGGATRQESVFNGLKAAACDYVLIHDAARPMVSVNLIKRAMEEVQVKKALTAAVKTIDTIKEVEDGKIIRTIDRANLYNTQTPQAFEYNLIKDAHERLAGQNFTDDAGMLEALGHDVYILDGSPQNIKITTQDDIAILKTLMLSHNPSN